MNYINYASLASFDNKKGHKIGLASNRKQKHFSPERTVSNTSNRFS